MKNMQKFTCRLAGFGIALVVMAGMSAASAQTNRQITAKVVSIKGAARYTANNTNWLPLKVGDTVKPGAFIQTAASSQADLLLSGLDMVRLYENTVLGVDKLAQREAGADLVTETQLDLRAGRITGNVKKLSCASKHEVNFLTGVAGIRSPATYTLSDTGEVHVLEGSVVIAKVGADGTVASQVVSSANAPQEATDKGPPEASDKGSNRTSKPAGFSPPPRRF